MSRERRTVPAAGTDRELSTQEIVGLFLGVMARMKQHFVECSAEFGLSFPQAWAVHELDEPMPMREVAERLGCDASNVTGIVDRLEERGLVERQPYPGDRRVKQLVLTDAGRALREKHHARLSADVPLVKGMSARERKVFADLLRRIAEP